MIVLFYVVRLCDMQFSFRQQIGPTTTTNIEHQPSFDKSRIIKSTVSSNSRESIFSKCLKIYYNFSFTQVETIPTVLESSITDPKSHSSSSIAAMPNEEIVSSTASSLPLQLPTKTRSFDDRECLFTVTVNESNAITSIGIDSMISGSIDDETKQSSENISGNNERTNYTKVRNENISAVLSSDTNLEESSLLTNDKKVRNECVSLSTSSPPKITVLCAPCIDDILAESAAQQSETIECDVSENIEQNAQQTTNNDDPTIEQCAKEIGSRKSSTSDATNLQLSLEMKKTDETSMPPEDLSPSMDEYEECNPTSGDYLYDTITGGERLVPGCVAPAPTPTPLIAPLAEIEIDPSDDDILSVTGIEKLNEFQTASLVNQSDTESNAKSQPQQHQPQQQQSQKTTATGTTTRTKKKKEKSTDRGNERVSLPIWAETECLHFHIEFHMRFSFEFVFIPFLDGVQVMKCNQHRTKRQTVTPYAHGKMSK